MALAPKNNKPNIDDIINRKTQQSFNLESPIKESEQKDPKNEELVQIITRVPYWVLEKQNEKYKKKGMKQAQWLRMLIMDDLDK